MSRRCSRVWSRYDGGMVHRTAHVERRPADAVVAAPARAVRGAYIEVVNASTSLERGLGQLRAGDLNQFILLIRPLPNSALFPCTALFQFIRSHRVAVGIVH